MRVKKRPRIIIVGSGVAGSMAALEAAAHGAEALVFSAVPPRRAPSSAWRGGCNAALDTKGERDDPAQHAVDTIRCGDFLAHQGPVWAMAEAAPSIAALFDRMGVVFERTPEGLLELARLWGSSKRRTALAGGSPGQQVAAALDGQLRRLAAAERVRLFEGWEFLSLVRDTGGRCCGIVAADTRTMEIRAFAASAVVVCTGGYAGLFGAVSAAPACDGSGIAACVEEGAIFANPEFVQLHPCAIPALRMRHAIPDAAFAAGARLAFPREEHPWYVLEERYPAYAGFVAADVAAREIARLLEERGGDALRLDVGEMPSEALVRALAEVAEFAPRPQDEEAGGIALQVVPAVVGTLGGLWVDARHATNLPGLSAAGAAACGYHGACALAGNEMLASAFGGMVAGRAAAAEAAGVVRHADDLSSSLLEAAKVREEDVNAALAQQEGDEHARALCREASEEMAQAAFIVRDNGKLDAAMEKMEELCGRFRQAVLSDRKEWANGELIAMRRIRRGLRMSQMVLAAARRRDESRGAHWKPAFPHRDDTRWFSTTKASWTEDGPAFDDSEKIETGVVGVAERKY